MLNAFNNDVYFAIQSNASPLQIGCKNIELFLQELKKIMPNQEIRFIGNGAELFKEQIINYFGTAYIPDPLPLYTSLRQIALTALQQWQQKKNIVKQVLPLYLKTLHYKKSISV